MAWTARADRFKGGMIKSASTPATLGPGHYQLPSAVQQKQDLGYAPFGSLQEQTTKPPKEQYLAAPGSYDPKLPGAYDSGLPRREVPFGMSGPQRGPLAPKNKALGPGPGDYKVEKRAPAFQDSRTMGVPQSDRKTSFRSTSAPSIPMFHQSFGYEELGNGRLVRQGPRGGVTYLSGRPSDSAGPGHYDTQSSLQSVGWSFGKTERKGLGPKSAAEVEQPGPGHYISRSDARGHIVRAPAVVSSFVSQSHQTKPTRNEDKPGPGQYHPFKVVPPSLREQHAELQYFGSTVERFKDLETSWDPGPGAYQSQVIKRLQPATKPFGASDTRFKKIGVDPGPGPGAYKATLENLTSGPTGTVSIYGAMGNMAFGTMSKRSEVASKSAAPGPGHYHSEEQDHSESDGKGGAPRIALRKRSLPSAAFKSDSNKHALSPQAQAPPPGTYDPKHITETSAVIRMPGKNEGFLSTAQRSSLAKSSTFPGPGTYIPGDVTGGKREGSFNRVLVEGVPQSGRPKSLGFAVSENRFKEKGRKKAPGPGQYDISKSLVTQTHNIYFGDLV